MIRSRWRPLLLALVLSSSACASAPGPREERAGDGMLTVGLAEIDITPDEPMRLTGYGNRTTPFESVRQRLRAKALAFGGEGEPPAILITADLIGIPRAMTEEVARRLSAAGVERARVAVAATHTHTGPSIEGVLPFIFGAPLAAEEAQAVARYSRRLTDALEGVARAALADRRPAVVSWAEGRVAFAANRRVLKGGTWSGFGVQRDGPVDHGLPVLAVHAPDGTLRGVVVNYACHATTLEGKDNFVHGDWPGAAQAEIERRHPGALAMVAIGAGADANPLPRGNGLADVERHGTTIADEVDRVLAGSRRRLTSPPAGRFRVLDLRLAPPPGRTEWAARAAASDARGAYARAVLERLDRGERLPATVPYPVQTWTFGRELAMVFLGGELVVDYGLRLERELDSARLWVTAYANDVAFYIPSERMIAEGGYEVDGSMVYYGHPAPLASGTEDRIVRAVLEMLPRTFAH